MTIWTFNFFRMQEIRYRYFGTRINQIMIFQNLKHYFVQAFLTSFGMKAQNHFSWRNFNFTNCYRIKLYANI